MDIVGRLRAAGCVFAEDEAALLTAASGNPATLEAMVRRRVTGEPIEYIVGWAEFLGRRYVVEPGVFVPRHRSALLATAAIAAARPGAVVLDLCCGCGALGGAVQAQVDVELYAADIDPAAVRCAQRNLRAEVVLSDLFANVPAGLRHRCDLIIVNAPYVPTDQIQFLPPEFREHEVRAALDGGSDGTEVQRRVIAAAAQWLAPAGVLLTETTTEQLATLRSAATVAGLVADGVDDNHSTVCRVRIPADDLPKIGTLPPYRRRKKIS